MAQSKKSQLLTLSLIATLLSFTPLLSSSFRSTYLYFIINVLIVVLGAEAGFLSPSSSPSSSSSSSSSNKNIELVEKKSTSNLNTTTKEGTINARIVRVIEEENNSDNISVPSEKFTTVEKLIPDKIIVCATEVSKMIKKCPSIPSIFFINEDEDEDVKLAQEDEQDNNNGHFDFDDEEEKEEELFEKAETFIVNFYKQLKMQREESWKNLSKFNADNRLLVN